jgi:simple sugar transport system ATP-binding protein
MVQQHFALVGVLSALENVMLGAEAVRGLGRLDVPRARARAEAVARKMGVSLPWDQPVEGLGVGDRQRLEIVRTLVREARVVILDEPTAVLTAGESEQLYRMLRSLAEGSRAVVVVTHHLDEVRDHADQVSVLRHGKLVSTRALTAASPRSCRTWRATSWGKSRLRRWCVQRAHRARCVSRWWTCTSVGPSAA